MTPKAFISYSWTNANHEDWVINLAERLISDGVDISIDKWDLKEGHDKFDFMESMVKSTEIDKVLIILDQKYSEKADKKSGGVGTETQIISPEIYANVSQEKFIPIVAECDEENQAFIPTYLKGRIYIDLSSPEHFETNYEKLLRNIFKRPSHSKPQLGKAPSYLFEETPMNFKTSLILRAFDLEITKNPRRINSISKDFLDEFYINLKDFKITFKDKSNVAIGKQICDNLNQYTPLRDDFLLFLEKIMKRDIEIDTDIIIRFLEKLPSLTYPDDDSSWSEYEYDNYRIIIHELFLYIVTIAIKNDNYSFLEDLLYSSYFIKNKYKESEFSKFNSFFFDIKSIKEYYKTTYSTDYFSPMIDLILTRVHKNFSRDMLIEADLICHYIATLNGSWWFPLSYVYNSRISIELFARLISKKHFERTKGLLGVSTAEELKEKLNKIKEDSKNERPVAYSNSYDAVIPIYKRIDIDQIALTR